MITQVRPIIRVLFYAPRTGFATLIPDVPFTLAHRIAGDNEVNKAQNRANQIKGDFNIEKFFTDRTITDKRMIPGFITLVASQNNITKPDLEQVFSESEGGTAGHTYQKLIDYNVSAQNKNKSLPQDKQSPMFSIYTVIDKPNDSTNLDFILKVMLENGYPNTFFDVLITASKGINPLLNCINKYNLDTNLVLISGASDQYMNVNLAPNSNVRAIILTHGGKDKPLINQQRINSFLNGNKTKLFIYSNKYDTHNQASLILGDTQTLHASIKNRTNRNFRYSYLPILINSAYYVGRRNTDWSFLITLLSKDNNIEIINNLMVGGGRNRGKVYCGCSGSSSGPSQPEPTLVFPNNDLIYIDRNNDHTNTQYGGYTNMMQLYCECDRRSQEEMILVGGNINISNININDHLYPDPEPGESPFSDIDSSTDDTIEQTNQTGGNMIHDISIIGKTVAQLRYRSNRSDYLAIRHL